MKNKFLKNFYNDISIISKSLDLELIKKLINQIKKVKQKKGRIFFLGVGGSAGNCSHAVNDFRKLCNIECYTPLDNVSELTARINDEGWNSSLFKWLEVSRLGSKDAIFIFSVGGGDIKKNVSINLISSIKFAKKRKAKIFGIVGRRKSFLKKNGDCVITVPEINKENITPYSEAYQAVIWHSIVSHPDLKFNQTKW